LAASTIAVSSSPTTPHFHEMHAERGQIFRDIADILVLGTARQDLVANHYKTVKDAVAFGPAVVRMLGP
jgi:hypothetical protein